MVTDRAHVARVAVMRRDFRTQKVHRTEPIESLEVRDIAAHDEIFRIDLASRDRFWRRPLTARSRAPSRPALERFSTMSDPPTHTPSSQ